MIWFETVMRGTSNQHLARPSFPTRLTGLGLFAGNFKAPVSPLRAKLKRRRLAGEPMRIKRYQLASGNDPQTLETEVSKLIAEGWQPFGQLVVEEPPDKQP